MKLAPEGRIPMTFQVQGVEWLANRRHSLLADEMGLGKTIQGICLINALNLRKVLIICPASVKLNWKRELENWLVTKREIQVLSGKKDIIEPMTEIIIVNYDLVTHSNIHSQLVDLKYDLLICDEAHYLKNMKAERTKAILGKENIAHKATRTIMMTGTPVLNRPVELYPILKVFSPKTLGTYNDYFKYARRYCDAYQDGFTFNVNGASNCDELNKQLRGHYMLRRTMDEVYKELPAKRFQLFFVEPTGEIKPQLNEMATLCKKEVMYHQSGAAAGELATIRRELATTKVNLCIEHIRDCVEAAGKLVIFAFHHDVIKKLQMELLDFNPVILDGNKSQQARQDAITKFKNDPTCQVFIGQIQAAGQGIDGLQHVCHNALFVEWSWVPGEIDQAVARLCRMGQEKPVLIQFLVYEKSIEEHMLRVALDKVEVIEAITK